MKPGPGRLHAITRPVSESLAQCELTHLAREPIEVARAAAQHAGYERLLQDLGITLHRAPAAPSLPDAVFVEDIALVLDELAVLTRPGAASRRPETESIATVLARFRPLGRLEAPAQLDGGDVLRIGRVLYVGRSGRTNESGVTALGRLLAAANYEVIPVEFSGCLHLKSAVTELADGLLLHNPAWVPAHVFPGFDLVPVDPREPGAANALRVRDTVVFPSHYPRTHALLRGRGLQVAQVDCSELAKAEGGVTCCSLLFEEPA